MAKGTSRGWKMAISIGGAFLIPVRLDKATKDSKVSLHEYHKDDMGAGGRKAYCKSCGKDLVSDDIVKGIEISKGQVVTFSKEELESLPLSTTKNIEVDRFVEARELNQLTFGTPYYVAPDEVGVKAFNLFMEGLKKLNKVAIGKVAIRNRESLCAIRPVNGMLVMSTICWSDELKDAPTIPKSEISDSELDLITQVIGKFSKDFVHSDFSDKYNDALKEMADKKLKGEAIPVAQERAQPQQNLEDALKAVLNK